MPLAIIMDLTRNPQFFYLDAFLDIELLCEMLRDETNPINELNFFFDDEIVTVPTESRPVHVEVIQHNANPRPKKRQKVIY